MKTFLIRRLLAAIPLIIAVTFITKALLVASPGNFLSELRLNPSISREHVAQIERMYHLDSNNVFERYWFWVWPAAGGWPLAPFGRLTRSAPQPPKSPRATWRNGSTATTPKASLAV